MLEKFLQEIGLSEKEAAIYLYLLKVDSASVAGIAKATDINRTTVYPVLDQLVQKEFAEEVAELGKPAYQARTPDRIESFLQEQKIKLEEQSQLAKDFIPRLKGVMREGGQRPVIEYGEGRDAIVRESKNHFNIDDVGGQAFLMYPRDRIEDIFSEKERKFVKDIRVAKNIKTVSIYTYSKGEYNPDTTGTRFRVDAVEYPITAEISVYQDRVRVNTLGENLSTMTIKNKDFSETMQTLFRLALKGLKK